MVNKSLNISKNINYYFRLIHAGLRVILREGWKSFLKKFAHYQLMRRYHSRIQRSKLFPQQIIEERISITKSQFKSIGHSKLAVIVHAYYVDLFNEICNYLNNIPYKYTLLISVASEADKNTISAKIKNLPMVENSIIKVVKNRGRDIAPLLVDFSTEINQFDYICKIHTKRSMHTPAHDEWRRYLYGMLLGSEERIRAILTIFKLKPDVGIIYPECFVETPYWALTWLKNKNIAQHIMTSLGLRFDPDEYLDFPNGSMFWARYKAIEPLLNLGLKTDDFPEEQGLRDETLHHTIERLFVPVARQAGFKHVIIKDINGNVFSNYSNKNFEQYLLKPFPQSLKSLSQQVEVVSFDIFGTLLTIPFTSIEMMLKYLEDSVRQHYDINNFYELRKNAEKVSHSQNKGYKLLKISDIYSNLVSWNNINESTAKNLIDFEINMYSRLVITRDEIVKAALEIKNSGKRVILIADTYLETEYIKRLLHKHNINFYDELYLTSEIGKGKENGDLYEHIIRNEKIIKDKFLHIGDDEQSDIQSLLDHGFTQYIHVMKPPILFRFSHLGQILYDTIEPYKGWQENLLYGMVSNHFCSCPLPDFIISDKKPLEKPFALGYTVFGPLIFNFITWLIRTSKNDYIDNLKFITREGFLLNRAYQCIAQHPSIKRARIPLPQADYFLCSRRTALFANFDITNMEPLLERDFNGTLRSFFEKRLYIDNMPEIEKRLGATALQKKVSLQADYKKILEIIIKVVDIISSQAEREKGALLEYCTNEGLTNRNSTGVVDLGYSGSIQKALSDLLKKNIAGYYLITDNKAANLRDRGLICRGYFADLVDPYRTELPIYRFSLLLEAILTQPQGQLIKFIRNEDGSIAPYFKHLDNSKIQLSIINEIHNGILKFINDMIGLFEEKTLDIEFPKNIIQKIYEMVITGDLSIGNLKNNFIVEDEYSGNNEISVFDFYLKTILFK